MTEFDQRIREVVTAVPYGSVVSYGSVAKAAGYPQASRMVAGTLQKYAGELPWWRVVNRLGILSIVHPTITAEDQAELLRAEGVGVREEEGVLRVNIT